MAGIDGFSLNIYNFEYVPGPPELIGLEFWFMSNEKYLC